MKITKLSFSDFTLISPQIHKLLASSNQSNIFLTPEWIQLWWEHWSTDQDEFYTLIVEDSTNDNKLIGYAPFYIKKHHFFKLKTVKELHFINSSMGSADHLNIVSLKNKETLVYSALLKYLFDNKSNWDLLYFDNLCSSSLITENLAHFDNAQFKIKKSLSFQCSYLSISSDWETFLNSKSKNFRYQTRAKRRKFENKLNGTFQNCASVEEIQQCFKTIAEFNPKRFSEQGDFSKFSLTTFQNFHIDVATLFLSKGWLDLAYLKIDTKIIAVIYNFIFMNKVYYFNIAFDPSYSKHSIGRILMGYSIENAFQKQLNEFDFLRGEHQYKESWATAKRQDIKIIVCKNTLLLNFKFLLEQKIKQLKSVLKNYLPKSLATKIKSLMTSKYT